jgi:hypothetical protein
MRKVWNALQNNTGNYSMHAASAGSCLHFLGTTSKIAIQAEVSRLWSLVNVIPELSPEGDDNREAIEAQLSVLTDELSLLQVLVEFDVESTDAYVLGAALQAAIWLQKGGEPPSRGWLAMSE